MYLCCLSTYVQHDLMRFIQVYRCFTPFFANSLLYDYVIIVCPFSDSWALGYFQFAVTTWNIYAHAFFENSNLIFFFKVPFGISWTIAIPRQQVLITETCRCYIIWKKGLCTYNYIKNFKMRHLPSFVPVVLNIIMHTL